MRHGNVRQLLLVCLLLAFAAVAVACGNSATPTTTPIHASVLIEPSPGDVHWYRDVAVPPGTDGYQLLNAAVDGAVEADWYPQYFSHFVNTIQGVAPAGSAFWSVFLWNQSTKAWEPLPVGADLFSVKDGIVMGWAIVQSNADHPQLPTSTP